MGAVQLIRINAALPHDKKAPSIVTDDRMADVAATQLVYTMMGLICIATMRFLCNDTKARITQQH